MDFAILQGVQLCLKMAEMYLSVLYGINKLKVLHKIIIV